MIQLMKNRERSVTTFVDGDQFKAVSRILPSCSLVWIATTTTPKPPERNFQRWDVMGGLVVRLKRDARRRDHQSDRSLRAVPLVRVRDQRLHSRLRRGFGESPP